jgi:hypothetical protein
VSCFITSFRPGKASREAEKVRELGMKVAWELREFSGKSQEKRGNIKRSNFWENSLLGAGEEPQIVTKVSSKNRVKIDFEKKVRKNKAKHKNRKFECKEETFFSLIL